ncbi:MAG: hypothetical protein A2Y33_15025 [Spirochaetes bacterium GWF1_51_8]|nr:MAG: hypothetical protein A2Y33_15025 [Spirochaetes bacterium GWF1_51_8]
MGAIIVSIVIFGVGLYFFLITNKKIAMLKEDLITKEARDEMGSLVAEFNRVAERNISLIEDRIEVLQGMLQKANQKLGQLDEKVARVSRPVVVEKLVEDTPRRESGFFNHTDSAIKEARQTREQTVDRVELSKPHATNTPESPVETVRVRETPHAEKQASDKEIKRPADEIFTEKPAQKKKAPPLKKPGDAGQRLDETASRSERLKALLRQGKSREELVDMGYMENEINLLSFIIRKE